MPKKKRKPLGDLSGKDVRSGNTRYVSPMRTGSPYVSPIRSGHRH